MASLTRLGDAGDPGLSCKAGSSQVVTIECRSTMFSSHLFIVGCPRSGTTALGNMLARHPQVVMGIERYGHRAFPANFSLTPELFMPDRFLEIKSGDTFYNSFSFAPEAYAAIEEKFKAAKWVGDKIPTLFRTLDDLFENFPADTRVLFLFRNIFDVAASYRARLDNVADDWSKDVAAAITDWSDALRCFRSNKNQDRVIPIIYEDFFKDNRQAIGLFSGLGLDTTPEIIQDLERFFTRARQLESRRARNITEQEVFEICARAPFGAYREVVAQARNLSSNW